MIVYPQIPYCSSPPFSPRFSQLRVLFPGVVHLSGQSSDLITLVILLMPALRISAISSCGFSSRWRKLIVEKTKSFLPSAIPSNTAVEALQHTPGESPLCYAKWINNLHIPQILSLAVNVQKKPRKSINCIKFCFIWKSGLEKAQPDARKITSSSTLQGLKLRGRDCATSGMVCLELSWEGHSHHFSPVAECHNLALNQLLAFKSFFHGTVYLITTEGGAS